jgi:DNA modification methylase
VYKILTTNCLSALKDIEQSVALTFLDPPFNQRKDYALHNDDMSATDYWAMMKDVCQAVYDVTCNVCRKPKKLELFGAAG